MRKGNVEKLRANLVSSMQSLAVKLQQFVLAHEIEYILRAGKPKHTRNNKQGKTQRAKPTRRSQYQSGDVDQSGDVTPEEADEPAPELEQTG